MINRINSKFKNFKSTKNIFIQFTYYHRIIIIIIIIIIKIIITIIIIIELKMGKKYHNAFDKQSYAMLNI